MSKTLLKMKQGLFLFLAIMGPGIITACADNDAGGIATYAAVGAQYGYHMLWLLFIITLNLAIIQEMAARMGAVTGQGLSDLIREQFGVKWTFFAMVVLLVANIATTAAEFSGIAASLEIFSVNKYWSVPLMAAAVWWLVVKSNYERVEKVFLVLCVTFISYVVSGFVVNPPWPEVFRATVTPSFSWDPNYVVLFIAVIGTTITPWMQFYVQSSVVDKGITVKDYKYTRLDVFFGAFVTDFVAFFIVVATAATLFVNNITIETAKDAAMALEPLAGEYATFLFGFGLFGASMLAASVLPLSTAYAICEAFGFESGVSKSTKEAPVFFGLYTALIVLGAGIVLLPNVSLYAIMLMSQVVNGILLPPILIFMLIIINNQRVMGEHTNSLLYNIASWALSIILIILTVVLLAATAMPDTFSRFVKFIAG